MIKSIETGQKTLEALGCKEIDSYCLVNNYGFTFKLNNRAYDIRYWANCYGQALNIWKVTAYCLDEGRQKDELDEFVYSALDFMFNYSNIKED